MGNVRARRFTVLKTLYVWSVFLLSIFFSKNLSYWKVTADEGKKKWMKGLINNNNKNKKITFIFLRYYYLRSERWSLSRWDTLEDSGLKRFFGALLFTLSASIRSVTDKSAPALPGNRRCTILRMKAKHSMCMPQTIVTFHSLRNCFPERVFNYRQGCATAHLCGPSASPGRPPAAPCWPLLLPCCCSAPSPPPGRGIWCLQPGQQVVWRGLGATWPHDSDLHNTGVHI